MRTCLVALLLCVGLAQADDWPGWRGPTGQGTCSEKDLPLEWDGKTGKNVLWKRALPGEGQRPDQNQSSPIVKKELVFLTTSYWPAGSTAKDFPEHHVVCFRAADGKPLWDEKVA